MADSRAYWKGQEPDLYSVLNYDEEELSSEEREEVVAYLPDLKGKKVLELASGIGRYTSVFATQAKHLTTVDISPQFVERNRKDHAHFKNIEFLCADAMELKVKEGAFDFIFANWLFMYLEDEEVKVLFGKIHRWLKPKGELFFRESCKLQRAKADKNGYLAHYRTEAEYASYLKKFKILQEGYVKTYVDWFGNPFQLYMHCKKKSAPKKKKG